MLPIRNRPPLGEEGERERGERERDGERRPTSKINGEIADDEKEGRKAGSSLRVDLSSCTKSNHGDT